MKNRIGSTWWNERLLPEYCIGQLRPTIQMTGHWLQQAGFEINTPLKIRGTAGCLVITWRRTQRTDERLKEESPGYEELIGIPLTNGKKRGPAPKLLKQVELISQMPKTKQKFVMDMLDTVIQQQS